MIYFDVANTLLHKEDLFTKMDQVLHLHGIQIPIEYLQSTHKRLSEVIRFPDKTSHDFYKDFNREFLYALGLIPSDELVDEMFMACKNLPWSTFNDVGAIKDLPGRVGVLSNWDASLKEKVEELIPVHFDVIIGSQEFGFAKPSPEIFKEALRLANDDEVVFVGDSIKLDIEQALEQGIRAVLIDRENAFPHYQGERIRHLGELSKLLGHEG